MHILRSAGLALGFVSSLLSLSLHQFLSASGQMQRTFEGYTHAFQGVFFGCVDEISPGGTFFSAIESRFYIFFGCAIHPLAFVKNTRERAAAQISRALTLMPDDSVVAPFVCVFR